MQIKLQIMEIVSTDHCEITFFKHHNSIGGRTERKRERNLAQLKHPGLSFSAKAARLCSTMPDGVTLLSQLDGNESDLWRCLERLPKIMFCGFF